MNAKERRHVARLEAKIRLLEEQRSEDWAAYRKCLQELVDVKLENESWREMAREILDGPP